MDPLIKEIVDRRRKLKMSARQLEEISGVSRGSVRRWEREESEPLLGNYVAVCSVLGLEVKVSDMDMSRGDRAIPSC